MILALKGLRNVTKMGLTVLSFWRSGWESVLLPHVCLLEESGARAVLRSSFATDHRCLEHLECGQSEWRCAVKTD